MLARWRTVLRLVCAGVMQDLSCSAMSPKSEIRVSSSVTDTNLVLQTPVVSFGLASSVMKVSS